MNRRSVPAFLAVPFLLATLAISPPARAADEGIVSGTGTSTIEKPAQIMRLQVQLETEGANLKDALDKLKARRDEVKAGLIKTGASEKSFDGGDVAISDGTSGTDRRAAMERAMRAQMSGGRGAPATAAAQKVTASCTIKVEWTLKADSTEGMIVAAQDIKDQIKSSKVLDAPKSAAQSEADEEAALMAQSEGNASPNDPVYLFVSRVTDEEQAKAMADAFTKAKSSATRLAKAAGMELGSLKGIEGDASQDPESTYALQEMYSYGGSASSAYRQAMLQARGSAETKEALSATPGKVSMVVVVHASFTLK